MLIRALLLFVFASSLLCAAPAAEIPNMTAPPKAGPVQLFPEESLKPGMKGVAWTVFTGDKPEPIPVEVIGIWKSAWGPKQDIIVAKLTGKASRTNVAGGMSGFAAALAPDLALAGFTAQDDAIVLTTYGRSSGFCLEARRSSIRFTAGGPRSPRPGRTFRGKAIGPSS